MQIAGIHRVVAWSARPRVVPVGKSLPEDFFDFLVRDFGLLRSRPKLLMTIGMFETGDSMASVEELIGYRPERL